jgi:two-component system, NarL family, response regulator DevR
MPTIQAPARPFHTTPNLPTSSPAKPRVLLADDYVPLLKAVTRLLEHDCHMVGHATTVAELFELVDTCHPDVVVLDISLPDNNGIEACRQLRLLQPGVKVVMLTAMDDEHTREAAFRAGASDFVPKASVDEFLEPAIRGAVSDHR